MAEVGKKMHLKPGSRVLVLNAPAGFTIEGLPDGARLVEEGPAEAVLVFVSSTAEVADRALPAFQQLVPGGGYWVAYPKKSSKVKTDINRDQGWSALSETGLEGVTQIAIDDTWSALRFRPVAEIKFVSSRRTAAGARVLAAKDG